MFRFMKKGQEKDKEKKERKKREKDEKKEKEGNKEKNSTQKEEKSKLREMKQGLFNRFSDKDKRSNSLREKTRNSNIFPEQPCRLVGEDVGNRSPIVRFSSKIEVKSLTKLNPIPNQHLSHFDSMAETHPMDLPSSSIKEVLVQPHSTVLPPEEIKEVLAERHPADLPQAVMTESHSTDLHQAVMAEPSSTDLPQSEIKSFPNRPHPEDLTQPAMKGTLSEPHPVDLPQPAMKGVLTGPHPEDLTQPAMKGTLSEPHPVDLPPPEIKRAQNGPHSVQLPQPAMKGILKTTSKSTLHSKIVTVNDTKLKTEHTRNNDKLLTKISFADTAQRPILIDQAIASSSSMNAPSTSTSAPSSTMSAPSASTSGAPSSTMRAQSTTMSAPSTTMSAPSTTMSAPSSSMSTPSTPNHELLLEIKSMKTYPFESKLKLPSILPSNPSRIRQITIQRMQSGNFGFSLRKGVIPGCGSSSVVTFAEPRNGSCTTQAGLTPGDKLVEINGQNVENLSRDDIADIIKVSPDIINLKVQSIKELIELIVRPNRDGTVADVQNDISYRGTLRRFDSLEYQEIARSEDDGKSPKEWQQETEKVWLNHRGGFSEAYLSKSENTVLTEGRVRVRLESGDIVEVDEDDIEKANPTQFDKVEDLTILPCLNESSILHTLRQRYAANLIHTFAGSHLIVINPMQQLPIYANKIAQMLKGSQQENMPPHIFSMAQILYRDMLSSKKDQSLLLMGKSGSGKTFNAQRLLQYLVTSAGSVNATLTVEKLNSVYTLMSAFGTCKTRLTNNASRFTHIFTVDFDQGGQICSAFVRAQMLEKTRVIQRTDGEQTFNVFILLLAGSDNNLREDLLLQNLNESSVFLAPQQKFDDKEKTSDGWAKLLQAFDNLNVTNNEVTAILIVLAAIYHLSVAGASSGTVKGTSNRLQFLRPISAQKAAALLGTTISELTTSIFSNGALSPHNLTTHVRSEASRNAGARSIFYFCYMANPALYSCEPLNLDKAVEKIMQSHASSVIDGQDYFPSNSNTTGQECLDAFVMGLYADVFNSVVSLINRDMASNIQTANSITVVDCPGFQNSGSGLSSGRCSGATFEDFCYNYTQERLQEFFHDVTLSPPQEVYKEENIVLDFEDVNSIEPFMVNLLDNPPHHGFKMSPTNDKKYMDKKGLLWILDEEAALPGGTDDNLITLFLQQHCDPPVRKNSLLRKGSVEHTFILNHNKGLTPIVYNVQGWLKSCREPPSYRNASFILQNSKIFSIAELFTNLPRQRSGAATMSSVNSEGLPSHRKLTYIRRAFTSERSVLHKSICLQVMDNVDTIIGILKKTQVHFVHCVLPQHFAGLGDQERPAQDDFIIDVPLMRDQIRSFEILDVLRLHRFNCSDSMTFAEVINKYGPLVGDHNHDSHRKGDQKQTVIQLLDNLGMDKVNYKIGNTKIFFRPGCFSQIDRGAKDEKFVDLVRQFQAVCRGYLRRKLLRKLQVQQTAIMCIQRNVRTCLQVREWAWWRLYTKIKPILNVHFPGDVLKQREAEIEELKIRNEKLEKEKTEYKMMCNTLENRLSDLTIKLTEDSTALATTTILLEMETADRTRLEKELRELQAICLDVKHHSEKLQSEVMNSEMTQSEVTQIEVTQSEVTQSEVMNSEMTQSEVTQIEVTQSEVAQSEVMQSEVAQSEVMQNEMTQNEVTQNDVTHSEVMNSEMTQSEVTQIEVTQSEVTQNEVTQSEMTQNEMTQSEVMQSEMTQSEMTQTRLSPAETVNNDREENEDADLMYKPRYERVVKELQSTKKRLQKQHEEEMEQELQTRKQIEKRLHETVMEAEEQRRHLQAAKKKFQRLTTEFQDLTLNLQQQMSRNTELERKQRRSDNELSIVHEDIKEERDMKEKLQRERDSLLSDKHSLEQSLHHETLNKQKLLEKCDQLEEEISDLLLMSKDNSQDVALKKIKRELEMKIEEQEEELDDQAGQIQLLEQAKLRLELNLDKMKQLHQKEMNEREEEIEEIRCKTQNRLRQLENQLENEYEQKKMLQDAKIQLQKQLQVKSNMELHTDRDSEKRLKRHLRRTKALLNDAGAALIKQKDIDTAKSQIVSLRNQLDDAEFSTSIAVKAKKRMELELQELQQQLEDITKAKQEAESKTMLILREKADIQSRLEDVEDDFNEVMKKYKAAVQQQSVDQITLTDQITQIEELIYERDRYKQQVSELQTRVQLYDDTMVDRIHVEILETKVRDLENRLELETTTRHRLESQVYRAKEQIERGTLEREDLNSARLSSEEANKRAQKQLRDLREEFRESQKRELEASQRKKELESRVSVLEGECRHHLSDLKLALKRVKNLQTALERDVSNGSDDDDMVLDSDDDDDDDEAEGGDDDDDDSSNGSDLNVSLNNNENNSRNRPMVLIFNHRSPGLWETSEA